jgi:hypothetical protein
MSDVMADFVRLLLKADLPMGKDEHIRIVEPDVSSLGESPPVLRLCAVIGDQLSPKRWRLVLQLDPEDVTALAEPSYRHTMAHAVVPANIMEWWHTRDASVVVSAEEETSG